MSGRRYHFPLISILLLFSTLSYGQAWSGILAPARAADWTKAGIPGGIPNRTTICANLTSGASTSTIQSAINNCPVGQVVKFGSGTYTLSSSIYANKGIVLRGSGPTQTTINVGSNNIYLSTTGSGGQGAYPGSLSSTNWTGGFTKGSTVLTVSSTSSLAAGQRVVLDQRNSNYVFPFAVEGECTSGNSCGRNESPLQFWGADNRAQPEIVLIQSVNSPTQITIAAPGIAHDYKSSLAPQVFSWNKAGLGNVTYAGVEDMKVDANGQNFAISMAFCDYCWVKNIAEINIARSGVFFWWGYRDEVRDSYFSSTNQSGGPTQYGIEVLASTFTRIENNIFYGITANILPETSYGLVAAYNYTLNTASGAQFGSFEPHLAHNYLQLYEGNVVDEIMYDNSWGSSSQMTSFRNRVSGHSANKTNYRAAFKINAHNWSQNIVGNVIGDPNFHVNYTCDNAHQFSSDNYEFDLGFWNSCVNGMDGSYDTNTGVSLMRWGNWDAVTWKANGNTNGVRWCDGSGGNPECTASETAIADANFPGLASPSTNLPDSFYLSGKPSWFGSTTWPPIGPDVTCSANCIANTANHAAMIPAQVCYANTSKNSSGYLTAFDADACYGSGTGGGGSSLVPPTGVTATPH